MPGKQAAHKCLWPGCGKKTLSRYCEQHTKQTADDSRARSNRKDKKRPSAWKRGYDARWRRYRLVFLTDNPWCAKCEGLVPATVVDHIISHRGDYDLFWDEGNHEGLCTTHHNVKTATEDGGFGRERKKE